MSYISKSLEMVVAQVTRKYPVVLVTGPRQVFKMMQGGQESLGGRVAVLSMTSLPQAEISGGAMEPFTVDEIEAVMEKRVFRKRRGYRCVFYELKVSRIDRN